MASSEREVYAVGKDELKYAALPFITTASAMDADFPILYAVDRPILVIGKPKVMFQQLDTFNSGVDINLETDDGSTETEVANYDTVGGGSATATGTMYDFTVSERIRIEPGEWLQARVDDDEDAACQGVILVAYKELEA
jgi:hypothetical protein